MVSFLGYRSELNNTMTQNTNNLAAYIWSLADLLRGDFKQSQYGRVILPFTLLRRLECVLEPTRDAVREAHAKYKDRGVNLDLMDYAHQQLHNLVNAFTKLQKAGGKAMANRHQACICPRRSSGRLPAAALQFDVFIASFPVAISHRRTATSQ